MARCNPRRAAAISIFLTVMKTAFPLTAAVDIIYRQSPLRRRAGLLPGLTMRPGSAELCAQASLRYHPPRGPGAAAEGKGYVLWA